MNRIHWRTRAAALAVVAFLVFGGAYLLPAEGEVSPPRWYSPAQVSAGEEVFVQNCLVCHGERGQATANWRQRNPDGTFPPPPLNGTAHTWHHSLSVLKQTIKNGGIPLGGSMPPFGNALSEAEIESVIAYFQSQWPDETYQVWEEKINRRQ